MTRLNVVLASLMVIGLMTGCGGGSTASGSSDNAKGNKVPGVTMTLKSEGKNVKLSLHGEGSAVIDWGDGSPVDSVAFEKRSKDYPHTYSGDLECTIKITGENITLLNCFDLKLTSLDISNNPALKNLMCNRNKLTNLDVSNNLALEILNCADNKFTSLDLSKNAALIELGCSGNQLTGLDLSKNAALKKLSCELNQLTSLDVSKNPALENLQCNTNKLTTMDISHNPELKTVVFMDNKLTSVVLGDNPKLASVNLQTNQLSAQELNVVLESLHANEVKGKKINLYNNPEAESCNATIAIKKGWEVMIKP